MKSRNAALSLIIGSLIFFLGIIYEKIYFCIQYSYKPELVSEMVSVILLAEPVLLALLGFSFLKSAVFGRRKISIVLSVVAAVWICWGIYFRVDYLREHYDMIKHPVMYFLTAGLYVATSVSVLIFAIGMTGNDPQKIRKGAIWLMAGSLVMLFQQLMALLERFFTYGFYGFELKTGESINLLFTVLEVLYPLGLLIMAISILKNGVPGLSLSPVKEQKLNNGDALLDSVPVNETNVAADSPGMPAVIDWISDFLLAAIPFFGVVFLVRRGMDNQKKHQRNWALAILFWAIIAIPLNMFVYSYYLDLLRIADISDYESKIMLILFIVFLSLIIVWGLLLQRRKDNDFDEDLQRGSVPSVWEWLGWAFVAGIPVLGFICLIVWALDAENPKKSWAVAMLIRTGIMLVFFLCFYATLLAIIDYRLNRSFWDL